MDRQKITIEHKEDPKDLMYKQIKIAMKMTSEEAKLGLIDSGTAQNRFAILWRKLGLDNALR